MLKPYIVHTILFIREQKHFEFGNPAGLLSRLRYLRVCVFDTAKRVILFICKI